ncbi:WD40/YVTN/BNR-like repeat-containing protein [Gymnodinialimonas ulvae]|uniref:WD40/YVTN/BNR-like repeat-containing protein n=1 Tax=Gymnodinialimonas ulvae TaxID=3126504 RepID=UPI0030A27D7D
MDPNPTLLIGTTKGAFVLRCGPDGWHVTGPHCNGWRIAHVVSDGANIYAGGGDDWSGAGIYRSADKGATWSFAKLTTGKMDAWAANDPDFAAMIDWDPSPPPFGESFSAIWSLHAAHGQVHAGTNSAHLLTSSDDGQTWAQNDALADFPDRDQWTPGAAGLVLHTIVSAPETPTKLWLGISAAGVFASEDGGASWHRRNRLSNAEACDGHTHPAAPANGDTGLCVHNIARAPGDLLYQQNHHGVWRSHDGGRHWDDITEGLPSTFGFPIALDPHDPDTLWTFPLNGDSQGRFPPDARPAVWRSTDGGSTWHPQRSGLPDRAWFTVLRQAMASAPGHIAFGTNTGSVFLSRDNGIHWDEVARHLPTILSVELAAL